MRSEADWTRWGDEHPWLAGIIQLGVYVLCWIAFFAVVWAAMAVWVLLMRVLGG